MANGQGGGGGSGQRRRRRGKERRRVISISLVVREDEDDTRSDRIGLDYWMGMANAGGFYVTMAVFLYFRYHILQIKRLKIL